MFRGEGHLYDKVPARSGDTLAVVDAAAVQATLVKEHDDALDALALELGDQGVDGVGLVAELETGHPRRGDDFSGALEGHADEGDLGALEVLHLVGRKDGVDGVGPHHLGGQEPELGEGVAVEAAVDGMAATFLHAQEVGRPFVELGCPPR